MHPIIMIELCNLLCELHVVAVAWQKIVHTEIDTSINTLQHASATIKETLFSLFPVTATVCWQYSGVN